MADLRHLQRELPSECGRGAPHAPAHPVCPPARAPRPLRTALPASPPVPWLCSGCSVPCSWVRPVSAAGANSLRCDQTHDAVRLQRSSVGHGGFCGRRPVSPGDGPAPWGGGEGSVPVGVGAALCWGWRSPSRESGGLSCPSAGPQCRCPRHSLFVCLSLPFVLAGFLPGVWGPIRCIRDHSSGIFLMEKAVAHF